MKTGLTELHIRDLLLDSENPRIPKKLQVSVEEGLESVTSAQSGCLVFLLTCAPTTYHFLVESFDCFGLKRPSVASVDFGHIHVG